MKNIDIIKAAQHVDDKFVSEAIDFAPTPKRSFKWVYAAAAACAALVVAAVPVIAKYRLLSTTPGYSESSSGLQTSSGSEDASQSVTTPFVAVTKLPDDTPRTFYNVITDEPSKEIGRADFDGINISDALAKCISKPHDPQDLFAVRLFEYTGADIKYIHKYFAHTYDKKSWYVETNGNGELYMTEEQIKNLEAPSNLAIILDIAHAAYRAEEIDAESLKTERFAKIYAEIQLDNNYDKLATELDLPRAGSLYGGGKEVGNPETRKIIEQYIVDFAKDYGIDTRLLFAGAVDSYDGKLSGEFDIETIEKMLNDERVISIKKSNGGGYVYESYGYFVSALKVTEKQMKSLPAGLTYYDIFDRLGNTAAYGNSKTRYYVTDNAGLIMLNFDSGADVCPLSGKELYDSAVPLYYTGELPDTVDNDMIFGVIGKNDLIVTLGSNGYLSAGYVCQAPEGCELIHEDGTPADNDDPEACGRQAFIKYDYQLETYPPQYQCTKIVLLDNRVI